MNKIYLKQFSQLPILSSYLYKVSKRIDKQVLSINNDNLYLYFYFNSNKYKVTNSNLEIKYKQNIIEEKCMFIKYEESNNIFYNYLFTHNTISKNGLLIHKGKLNLEQFLVNNKVISNDFYNILDDESNEVLDELKTIINDKLI